MVQHANHYYCFVVRTNTIIYNNQQQQKKESDKECYYCSYCIHDQTIQYITNCSRKVYCIKLMLQLTTQMTYQLTTRMMTTNTIWLSHNYLIHIVFVFVSICFRTYGSRLDYPKRELTKCEIKEYRSMKCAFTTKSPLHNQGKFYTRWCQTNEPLVVGLKH